MKILIVGSTDNCTSLYKQVCHNIAEGLSKKHEIVIGSDRDTTADYYIMEKLSSTNTKKNITIYYHKGKNKPFSEDAKVKKCTKANIKYEKLGEDWDVARTPQIVYSDVIIIIGGGEKTKKVIELAQSLGKNIIPIPETGGEADNHWVNFSANNIAYKDDLTNLSNWDEKKSIQSIENFLKKTINSKSEFSQIGIVPLLCVGGSVLMLITFWILLFFQKITLDMTLSLFIVSFISSILGVSLYAITNILDKKVLETKEVFIIRPIAGLLITFGLVILYLASTFTVNGSFDSFSTLNENGNYHRIGITFSLLGLFAGLMTEKAIINLKKKLSMMANKV